MRSQYFFEIVILDFRTIYLFIAFCRFVSDGTIEYNGFRAVYTFIPNPLENIPFISKCEFEIGGPTDYIGEQSSL